MTDIMQKYGLLIPNINPCDETFMELLPQIICNFHDTNVNWKERKNNPAENPYQILKQQLETLLTERNIVEVEEVLRKSENGRYLEEIKNMQFFEYIYYEIYHDDPAFKVELIHTPIDVLLKLHF